MNTGLQNVFRRVGVGMFSEDSERMFRVANRAYKQQGRGILTVCFESIKDALNPEQEKMVVYLPYEKLHVTGLTDTMIKTYNPETEFVVTITIPSCGQKYTCIHVVSRDADRN